MSTALVRINLNPWSSLWDLFSATEHNLKDKMFMDRDTAFITLLKALQILTELG